MDLPEALRAAIASVGARQERRALARAAESLSQGYRAADSARATARALNSTASVAAYAATRAPATFAALAAALGEARALLPGWAPVSALDAGAGPAVSAWATPAVWPSLRQLTLLERDQRMLDLGRELLDAAPVEADVSWRQVDVTGEWGKPATADLVICAYTLNEIPETRRGALVERLWAATEAEAGALALVAPGTPAGFAAIRVARDRLITLGGHIVAPCPHARACPMAPGDWCHMGQRLARSRLHRQLKGGDAPFEDEKYSYVIASRQPGTPIAARVIRRPVSHPGRVTLDLCAPDGLERREVTRSDKEAFRLARDARWGSAWPLGVDGSSRGESD